MSASHPWLSRTEEVLRVSQTVDIREIEALLKRLKAALENGDTIYVAGCGGSHCSSQHIAEDLLTDVLEKSSDKSLSNILCLGDNGGTVSGFANDCGFKHVFSNQIQRMAVDDDVVILLSGSGMSPSIVEAAKMARLKKCTLVGFTGFTGGELWELSDIRIHVDSFNMTVVQDIHLMVYHYIHQQLQILFKYNMSFDLKTATKIHDALVKDLEDRTRKFMYEDTKERKQKDV